MRRDKDLMLTAEELRLRRRKRRIIAIVLGAAFVLMALVFFTGRTILNRIEGWQARRHAQKAFAFIEQEKWTDARGEAVAAYQLRPNEPEALRAIAKYLSRTRQQQALEFWEQLEKEQPLTRDDRRDEATIALMSGETARAETAVQSLLARNDTGPPDWFLAAQLAAQKSNRDEAQNYLQKILHTPSASEREQFQAAVLQLVMAGGDEQANAQRRAGALDRLKKLSGGKSATALDALVVLAQHALSSPAGGTAEPALSEAERVPSSESTDATHSTGSGQAPGVPPPADLVHALENHPLAKAPHKLLALDLQMHENPAAKEACIARAIREWKESDATSLAALATWLNSKGEYQHEIESIPLAKALQTRELFLQHVDALGALGRWSEIKQLLESERFPLDPVVQKMYLARSYAQLGEKTAAENNWQRALEAAGNEVQKLIGLADYAEKNGANEIAESAYGAAVATMPKLRAAQQGRLRMAQASRDTKKIHAVLTDLLKIWPNDPAIQNDEAYTRLLLLPDSPGGTGAVPSSSPANPDATAGVPPTGAVPSSSLANPDATSEQLIAIEHLAEQLVQREPTSLPHRTLLALARLRQHRPVAALQVYSNIQLAPNALSPSALAVHAAVLAANNQRDDARSEIQQAPLDKLLPEEQAGTADLRE